MRGGAETIYPEYQARLQGPGGAPVTPAEAPRVSQARNPDTGEVVVLPVQGNVYLLAGGGGNTIAHVGSSGTLLVDSKAGPQTDRILAEVKRLSSTSKPIKYVLNTSADPDHLGGNEGLAKVLGSLAPGTWYISTGSPLK